MMATMTGGEIAQIITALGLLVTACTSAGALIIGLLNRSVINTVKTQTDGMLTAMSEKSEELGHAKGKAEEIQYQRDNHPPVVALDPEDPVKVAIVSVPMDKKS